MRKIGDLLTIDLTRRIEEIVKVYQDDQDTVYRELTEYVVTDRLKEQYRKVLKAIADAPSEPDEGIGIWISGFFGSGKSSFAKTLGYIMANNQIMQHNASDLFNKQINDKQISDLVNYINTRIPSNVVMFDVSVDRSIRKTKQTIAEIIYSVLLNELGYSNEYEIAELEIELEANGKLEEFIQRCEQKNKQPWDKVRKGASKFNHASAILHDMNPELYPVADSWLKGITGKNTEITVNKVVERIFELTSRRHPGKIPFFILDEVGQYVARSADKIEDLRAFTERLGKESKNRLKKNQIKAPVWLVVTSQEKLNEVVDAIDSKRVELSRLQDRFRYYVDMAPSDIREVATKRVLAKNDKAVSILSDLYDKNSAILNDACRLERTTFKEIDKNDFVNFYPYLPHYIELSIDIVSGIRLQPGAPRHLGGSNRTIIKQAYEMLASDRTNLKNADTGSLVTLDKIYELVEANLSTEKRKDIDDVNDAMRSHKQDNGWGSRVARVIRMLEFTRKVPRTEKNIAACLVDKVGEPAPIKQVVEALARLKEHNFIRSTEEGYKLQTNEEKNWENERRGFLEPKPRDRNQIIRDVVADVFSSQTLKTYRYKNIKSFKVGIIVDGVKIEDGNIPLAIGIADSNEAFQEKLTEIRNDSRAKSNENNLYWVFSLDIEIDKLVVELFASNVMINNYEVLKSQNKITHMELECLSSEKQEAHRLRERLRDKISTVISSGSGLFQGTSWDGSALGKNIKEIFRSFFDKVVPRLYQKFDMGACQLKGNETEAFLKAVSLNSLPQIFYSVGNGLNLVVQDSGKFIPNPDADITREIFDYIELQYRYDEKVTGKDLDTKFCGLGYGWDRDIIMLALAVLLRAGRIEVTHQGRRYQNYMEPQCRIPFVNNTAFRSASFAPREIIDIKVLTTAVQHYEDMTGEEVDVDENAISSALKTFADTELESLLPVKAVIEANQLPGLQGMKDYEDSLRTIVGASSDERVKILSGEGKALRKDRDRINKIRDSLKEEGLSNIKRGKRIIGVVWPFIQSIPGCGEQVNNKEELADLLSDEKCYDNVGRIKSLSDEIAACYWTVYDNQHAMREEKYLEAIDEIKGMTEWISINEEMQETVIPDLLSRCCGEPEKNDNNFVCNRCRANLNQIKSDILAVGALKTKAVNKLRELTTPEEEKAKIVKVSDFFRESPGSKEDVDEIVQKLKDYLYELIENGEKFYLEW